MNKITLIDDTSCIKYNHNEIKKFCLMFLEKINITNWEFSLFFCDNDYISRLNEEFRKKHEPTDILTFSEIDSKGWIVDDNTNYYAGDIVISVPMLEENASNFCVRQEEELKRLLIHGMLHLNGMDHKTNNPDEKMLIYQEKYLKEFGEFKF